MKFIEVQMERWAEKSITNITASMFAAPIA